MIDCESQGVDVSEETREAVRMMQASGAFAAFADLAVETQQTYVEVSLTELAAYLNWRSKQAGTTAEPMEFEAGWDLLDMDAKADWIVDDPRTFLSEADAMWHPLLTTATTTAGDQTAAMGAAPEHSQSLAPSPDIVKAEKKEEVLPAAIVKTEPVAPEEPTAAKEAKPAPATKPAAAQAKPRGRNGKVPRRRGAEQSEEDADEGSEAEEDSPADESEADLDPAAKATERPVTEAAGQRGRKRKEAVPESCCPEVDDAVCCVCSKDGFSPENDLALCDKCDRGFHQLCHDPPVASFGGINDQWFCSECTVELAKERSLKAKLGDFVWASSGPGNPVWPARVHQIDFTSLADPKPYWVQYFDSGRPVGNWVGESALQLWSAGPTFASIKESGRRLAVRLAEGEGAAPISSNVAQAPVKPLPKGTRRMFEEARRRAPAPEEDACMENPAKRTRRLTTKSPPHRHLAEQAEPDDMELQSQVAEMRNMVREAKERQARLERQVDEAMSQSQRVEN